MVTGYHNHCDFRAWDLFRGRYTLLIKNREVKYLSQEVRPDLVVFSAHNLMLSLVIVAAKDSMLLYERGDVLITREFYIPIRDNAVILEDFH